LLCVPEHQREIDSVKCIEKIQQDIKYVKHINHPYTEKPPVESCYRPFAVTHKRGHKGQLWCGHYGAFLAHKRAIFEEFGSDFLLICECDCQLTIPHVDFLRELDRACAFMEKENIAYMSFGNDEKNIQYSNDKYTLVNQIFKTHCILFPKKSKEFLLKSFNESPWDNIDFFYNRIFNGQKIAISNQPFAKQVGKSLIDFQIKII
jgi:hypothetical protein